MTARLAAAAIAALALSAPAPAHAAFPGANGTIAFTSDRDGDTEIYAMRADGSALARLTDNTASDFGSAYSPDGARIVSRAIATATTRSWSWPPAAAVRPG